MKRFLIGLFLLLLSVNAYAGWDVSKPADNEKLKDTPALLRANFSAIQTGTDANLCITNAKMCSGAAVGDDKLSQITSPAKVSGAALTLLGSIPSSANGQVPIVNGGTGQSTATAAINALLPSQTGNSGKALVTDGANWSLGYPTSLTISSAAIGDILYYNGTVWTRIAAGTSGYYLKAAGAAAPGWVQPNVASSVAVLDASAHVPTANLGSGTANSTTFLRGDQSYVAISQGMSLVSVTTVTGAATTGNITIAASKQYYVTLTIDPVMSSATTAHVQFNGDTSGNYQYSFGRISFASTPTLTTEGSGSTTSINLCPDIGHTAMTNVGSRFAFNIDTYKGEAGSGAITAAVSGSGMYSSATYGLGMVNFAGAWINDTTVTSFLVYTDQNVNMVVRLYELAQSL